MTLELTSKHHKHRKKGTRLKLTEDERKLNKEFAAELEIKRKLDKRLEAKMSEMLKKLNAKKTF